MIPNCREFIVKCIAKEMKYELQKLCSDNFSSVLTSQSIDNITNFNWSLLINEADRVMSTLMQVLSTCTQTHSPRLSTQAVIGTIISILAKHRQPHSCLLQKVISLLLYAGHCSKKVTLINCIYCFMSVKHIGN